MARTKKAAARRAVAKQVVGISRANSKGKKKGIAQDNQPSATKAVKNLEQRQKQQAKELRRGAKLQRRKHANRQHRNGEIEWGVPPPSNLVAKLELPKSKYHSYFEFMENTERKEKKLEFEVTNKKEPYPGYKFVPIGDPLMTTKCKELSREQGAMIFIVSATTEKMSKISDHVHRIGYHFREYIVDEARKLVGETNVSDDTAPIPKTQEEINQQADAALRDLFPRIPNTDRQMILDHAFRLGAVFNGAPVVGLQPDIPLSRRVQLAVLAHIRHTHTRYDLLLRETSWENARKVVEPVCLDFIIKWRGDEETGRDQIDEILREVVVISDSEDSDDDSSDDEIDDDDDDDDDESSEEEETSSTESELIEISEPESHMQLRQKPEPLLPTHQPAAALPAYQKTSGHNVHTEKQRGFRRYQTAWEQAVSRRNHGSTVFDEGSSNNNFAGDSQNRPTATQGMHASSQLRYAEPTYGTNQ
ncbi:hypothetical protein BJ878DRAFT_412455 [Calycina marina]|uniref:DUF2293 domain-containing protein n=1 Tax=Calycina marina TaxID=1763456 RepID=A0A9P7ZAZ2_9HELO|nr:hypothetical protein BJ878DRAFT_412455 [Calycina marina]